MRWHEIKSAPGFSISDTGLVRNDRYDAIIPWKLNDDGYRCTFVYVNAHQTRLLNHIEVAKAFIQEDLDGYDVHHINHDRSDASLDNLMVLTESEHRSLTRMENNGIPLEKLIMVCEELQEADLTFDEILTKYGISRKVLLNIIYNFTYKEVTKHYDFSDVSGID